MIASIWPTIAHWLKAEITGRGYARLPTYIFWERHRLAEYTDDMALVDNALRNCLPLIANHIPTVQQLAGSQTWNVVHVAFVSCWIQFRDGGTLEHVDPAILLAAKVDSSKYQTMSDGDYHAFERELDRLLFPRPEQAEEFARTFIEPGMAGPRDAYTRVSWLSNKELLTHLRTSLPIEWLRTFPAMPVSAREELFNLAAIAGDRAALLDIIGQGARAAAIVPADESAEGLQRRMDDLRFWQIRKFFFEGSDADGWEDLRDDPNTIFSIANKAGRFGDEIESWPSLSAEKIFKILDGFVGVWPAVHLPSSYGSGDPPEETAYRFLTDIVWRIGRDTPERALPVLERLIADVRFAGFSEALLTLRAETIKKFALSGFNAPAPRDVAQMFDSAGLASVEDLRAFAVEELGWLQGWLKTADTDPLAAYFQAGAHVDENTARNRVVDSLHLADDRHEHARRDRTPHVREQPLRLHRSRDH